METEPDPHAFPSPGSSIHMFVVGMLISAALVALVVVGLLLIVARIVNAKRGKAVVASETLFKPTMTAADTLKKVQ